jgi:hypothetical protein
MRLGQPIACVAYPRLFFSGMTGHWALKGGVCVFFSPWELESSRGRSSVMRGHARCEMRVAYFPLKFEIYTGQSCHAPPCSLRSPPVLYTPKGTGVHLRPVLCVVAPFRSHSCSLSFSLTLCLSPGLLLLLAAAGSRPPLLQGAPHDPIASTSSPCVRLAGRLARAFRRHMRMAGSGLTAVIGTPLQLTYPSKASSVQSQARVGLPPAPGQPAIREAPLALACMSVCVYGV